MVNRYRNIKRSRDGNGIPYINNPIYPDIPETEDDVYIITSETDRYDLLASRFYGDSSLWWIIPAANKTTSRDTIYPTPGIQLRIPANKDDVIARYESLNRVR